MNTQSDAFVPCETTWTPGRTSAYSSPSQSQRETRLAKAKKRPFDVSDFLNKMDGGRTLQTFRKNQEVFAQGDPANAVFYIQEGKVKVFVVSQQGKEAVVALHGKG